VLTDGMPNWRGGPEECLEWAEKHREVPIDTIGFGRPGDWDPVFLKCLSEITGGIFRKAKDARRLAEAIMMLSPAQRPMLGKPK